MVRGALPLIIILYRWLQSTTKSEISAGIYTGLIVMIISIWATRKSHETYGKDLNYVEHEQLVPNV